MTTVTGRVGRPSPPFLAGLNPQAELPGRFSWTEPGQASTGGGNTPAGISPGGPLGQGFNTFKGYADALAN